MVSDSPAANLNSRCTSLMIFSSYSQTKENVADALSHPPANEGKRETIFPTTSLQTVLWPASLSMSSSRVSVTNWVVESLWQTCNAAVRNRSGQVSGSSGFAACFASLSVAKTIPAGTGISISLPRADIRAGPLASRGDLFFFRRPSESDSIVFLAFLASASPPAMTELMSDRPIGLTGPMRGSSSVEAPNWVMAPPPPVGGGRGPAPLGPGGGA
mmetsp:Transcript_49467/g.150545  ORF Transcript_49467/g.150545 Transcript_49467/m.150545 type:complete len:215 (-) Transcript_49467:2-646(-)